MPQADGERCSLATPNAVVLGPQTGNTFTNLTQTGTRRLPLLVNGCSDQYIYINPLSSAATIALARLLLKLQQM
jgi:hypothetical protein